MPASFFIPQRVFFLRFRSFAHSLIMAVINNSSPSTPTEMDTRTDKGFAEGVAEKNAHADDDSDASSELKQAGIKRVEAVTQAWSPAMMWLVFVLYVHHQGNPTVTANMFFFADYTSSPSSTLSSKPSTAAWSPTSHPPSTSMVSLPSPPSSAPS